MNEKQRQRSAEQTSELIAGRNPVSEALKSGRPIDKLLVAKGEKSGALTAIIARAKAGGVLIKETDRQKLDYISGGAAHQGVIAFAAVKEYCTIDDIFRTAEERGQAPFIIVLDEIEDPHNLGAIIRTAECAGAHGVIIPKRRSAGLSFTVGKASAGAVEYMNISRVTNTAAAIEELKRRGVWVYGADMDGQDYSSLDFSGARALVVGNEGKGISRLVREKCDVIVSLPMRGRVSSLNASVAAGILMYAMM